MYNITVVLLITTILFISLTASADQKQKIAVLNLKNTEGVSSGESELLTDRLRNDLFSTGKVEVMEREQMQTILTEQGFQQSGATCTDEGCMVEFGKLLGVKMLISGSIGKLGRLFMINVKSINVETAQIMKVVSEDIRGDIEDVVSVLPTVAAKLTGSTVSEQPHSTGEETPGPEEKKVETPVVTGPLPCDGSIYLEKIHLPRNIFSFTLDVDALEDVDQDLAEAFGNALNRSIISASAARIDASTCKTLTIRVVPTYYSTAPAVMKQSTGTLHCDVSVYMSPQDKKPVTTVTFKNTGDRHWGQTTPLTNAFEAIAESIDDDFYSKVKKQLKEAGFRR